MTKNELNHHAAELNALKDDLDKALKLIVLLEAYKTQRKGDRNMSDKLGVFGLNLGFIHAADRSYRAIGWVEKTIDQRGAAIERIFPMGRKLTDMGELALAHLEEYILTALDPLGKDQ